MDLYEADLDVLSKVEVEYVTFPGWETSISGVKSFNDLPENARKYILFIEEQLGVRVEWIGVGPERSSMLHINKD